jgi:hypothetical protein
MKANKLIEIASVLDPTGEKRISLKYDNEKNSLHIEDESLREITSSELQYYIDELNKLKDLVNDIKSKPDTGVMTGTIKIKFKKLPPLVYTAWEQRINYYYFCMTHNFGQGEGKMFDNWPQIPFEKIKKWNEEIKKKYRDLGYDI